MKGQEVNIYKCCVSCIQRSFQQQLFTFILYWIKNMQGQLVYKVFFKGGELFFNVSQCTDITPKLQTHIIILIFVQILADSTYFPVYCILCFLHSCLMISEDTYYPLCYFCHLIMTSFGISQFIQCTLVCLLLKWEDLFQGAETRVSFEVISWCRTFWICSSLHFLLIL